MRIVDRTSQAAAYTTNLDGKPIVSREAATRPLSAIHAVVLHQLGFDRGNALDQYDRVIAHYVVLRNGTVLHLRPHETLLNDAHARASLHIEFASLGSQMLASDRDVRRGTVGKTVPSWAELEAGRTLVRHLCASHRLRFIYAHRQFNLVGRANCPGPHIWRNVGDWCARRFGFSSAGAPHPIPDSWLDPALDIGPA